MEEEDCKDITLAFVRLETEKHSGMKEKIDTILSNP